MFVCVFLGKGSDESVSTPPLIIGGKSHLPFQLQTEYTASDGSVLVRVITKVKPVTEDRNVAERGMFSTLDTLDSFPSNCLFQTLIWMSWGAMLSGHQLTWLQRESFLRQELGQ